MKRPAVKLYCGQQGGLWILATLMMWLARLTAPAASSWTYLEGFPIAERLNAVAGLVAVGDRGYILLTSPILPVDSGVTENLLSVAFSGSLYVAAGEGGVVLTSKDGLRWASQRPFGPRRWISTQYKAGIWRVCAEDGTLLSSSNPASGAWVPSGIPMDLIESQQLTVFDASGPAYAVGSAHGKILFSPDLRNWRLSQIPTDASIRDIEFGGFYKGTNGGSGYWLAAASDRVWKSVDQVNWTILDLPVREVIHCIKSLGDGPESLDQIWMLVGNNGTALASRRSGLAGAWVQEFPVATSRSHAMDLYGASYWNGNWYLVGDEGATLYKGGLFPLPGGWSDFVTRARNMEQPDHTCVLASGNDVVMAGYGILEGSGGGGKWIDGSTWKDITFGAAQGFAVVTNAPTGEVSKVIAGDRWLRIHGLATDGRLWIACGADGKVFFANRGSERLLLNWATVAPVSHGNKEGVLGISEVGTSSTLYAAAYGNGTWVMVGEAGTIRYTSSPVPVVWAGSVPATINDLFAVKYAEGMWVAVGDHETILNSVDGKTWKKVHGPEVAQGNDGCGALLQNTLWSVAYGAGLWITVGDDGLVLQSRDGESWIRTESQIRVTLRAVCFESGTWMIAGDNGLLASSTRGVDWSLYPAATDRSLRALTVQGKGDGARWIAVGSGSVMFTMPVTVNPAGLLPVGFLQWARDEDGLHLRWSPGDGQWLLTESDALTGLYRTSQLEISMHEGLMQTSALKPVGFARYYRLVGLAP